MSSEISPTEKPPVGPVAIEVSQVSKGYRIYSRPIDRLKQSLTWKWRQYYHEFKALHDVSFQVHRGEMVGLIGRNGSGKSTLLQIIAGTLAPSAGQVRVPTRVAALLELGSGFDIEATGRENVYMNAAILGLSRDEIQRKYEAIVAFAGIGEFIDQPVKTYSSGMVVRLAFAVSAHVDAEVLIVDEALAVGDAPFQAKCFRRIDQLRKNGVTILLATHDITTVSSMCDRALLLDHGGVIACGPAKAVAMEYYRRVREVEQLETEPLPQANTTDSPEADANEPELIQPASKSGYRVGDGRAEIRGYAVYDHQNIRTTSLQARQNCRVVVSIHFCQPLQNPHVGIAFRDVQGRILQGAHTMNDGHPLGPVHAGQDVRVTFEIPLALNLGEYLLMIGVAEHQSWADWKDCDVFFDVCQVSVYGDVQSWGLVNVPVQISLETLKGKP